MLDFENPDFKSETLAALEKHGHVHVDIGEPDIEVSIHSRDKNRLRVTAKSIVNQKIIGTISSPNEKDKNHRPLKVTGAKEVGLKNSLVAKQILAVLNSLEGTPNIEIVPHYELIRFYIKEGYVPIRRINQSKHTVDPELEKLFEGLVEFQSELNQGHNPSYDIWKLPKTILEKNPIAAKKYWEKIEIAARTN